MAGAKQPGCGVDCGLGGWGVNCGLGTVHSVLCFAKPDAKNAMRILACGTEGDEKDAKSPLEAHWIAIYNAVIIGIVSLLLERRRTEEETGGPKSSGGCSRRFGLALAWPEPGRSLEQRAGSDQTFSAYKQG